MISPATLTFKHWISHGQPPEVQRLLRRAAQSGIVSLAGGLPTAELFPAAELELCFQRVISQRASEALQYTWAEGFEPLRQQIVRFMVQRGVVASIQNVLIINGAQQALDLLPKLFLRGGDKLLIESPTYVPAIQAFEMHRPALIEVQRSSDGLDLAQLEEALKTQHPRMFYLIATGHNPTGANLGQAQRQQVLQLCRRYNTLVVEDAAYGEIQYEGNYPPLRQLALADEEIIYIGSFSKILSPGLRIGWVVASEKTIQGLITLKQASDLQCNSVSQFVLAEYLQAHSLSQHLQRVLAEYRRRRDGIIDSLSRHFPEQIAWTHPASGFSLWVTLPPGLSSEALLEEAIVRGVAFEPGAPFFPVSTAPNFLRLSFSNYSPERIEEGIRALGTLLKEKLGS